MNLASSTLIIGPRAKESDLVESLRKLAGCRFSATLTTAHLAALPSGVFPASELINILKDANKQYRELSEALSESIF